MDDIGELVIDLLTSGVSEGEPADIYSADVLDDNDCNPFSIFRIGSEMPRKSANFISEISNLLSSFMDPFDRIQVTSLLQFLFCYSRRGYQR